MECGAYAKTVAFLSLTCKKCAVTKVTPNGGGFAFRSVRVPQVSRFSRPGGFRSVNVLPAGCPAASQFSRTWGFCRVPQVSRFSRPGGFRSVNVSPAGCLAASQFSRTWGVLPGAPGLAPFETWGFSLRKRIACRVPRGLAVFETWGFCRVPQVSRFSRPGGFARPELPDSPHQNGATASISSTSKSSSSGLWVKRTRALTRALSESLSSEALDAR